MGKVVKHEPGRQGATRCTRLQSRPRPRKDSPLTPELKDFIDRVVVPILVKEYLAVTDFENELAKSDSDAANSVSRTAAPELRV